MMDTTRRGFFKGGLASLGFLALPGGLFAAPAGWKPGGRPNLVLGVVSDTHIRSAWDGKSRYWRFPLTYFKAALEYFRAANVDAVVHCGDFAHRGMAASMRFHAETWREVFGKSGGPVKLMVSGNHDIEGWTYGNFGGGIFPDPEERANYILGARTGEKWEDIWGEKYEPVWHKEVKGYHFVGHHWGADEAAYPEADMADFLARRAGEPWMAPGAKPFFLIRHVAPGPLLSKAIGKFPNAITLFGHAHGSASNWNMARLHRGNAVLEVPSCEPRGTGGLCGTQPSDKAKAEGAEAAGAPRVGYVVRVYDDMLVVERREFGEGGSLGPDWVLPLGDNLRHSFSPNERKRQVGKPQFGKNAKLKVSLDGIEKTAGHNPDGNPVNPVQKGAASACLSVRIPLADGNPDSRVYAYEVVVIGEAGSQKLFKCVFAAGVNMGIGHETNHGVTTLKIPVGELPPGNQLTIGVRPCSSLGTKGQAIATVFKAGVATSPVFGRRAVRNRQYARA